MRLLLDTHILTWLLSNSKKVNDARAVIQASEQVMFSAASIWEIAIKHRLERVDFVAHPRAIVEAAERSMLIALPVGAEVASKVAELPMHHRDPFDRLLVAQAIHEHIRLLTADKALIPYSSLVHLIP